MKGKSMKKRGFTLIELLVVIAIIGILISIILPVLKGNRYKGKCPTCGRPYTSIEQVERYSGTV